MSALFTSRGVFTPWNGRTSGAPCLVNVGSSGALDTGESLSIPGLGRETPQKHVAHVDYSFSSPATGAPEEFEVGGSEGSGSEAGSEAGLSFSLTFP